LTGVALVVDRTLPALLATELTEAPEILLVRSLTGDPVFDLPPPVRTLAVDVVDVRRVRAVGVEAVEALVLAVRYELVLSVAVEAVDIGRTAPPEMDLVETREVGRDAVDVPAFPVLFVEIVKRERAVECVLPRELGREEEVKLAEDGDVRIDEDVVVDLRIGVWDFTLEVVCLALDPVLVLAREVTLASDALVIKVFFRGGGGV
jgi:hypothetical protein